METELDKARWKWYLEHPECIVDIGEWEVAIFCAKCKVEIPKEHLCLDHASYYEFRSDHRPLIRKHSCPHCLHKKGRSESSTLKMEPIETFHRKRRFIATQIKTTRTAWWSGFRKVEVKEGFWEYHTDTTEEPIKSDTPCD